MSPTKIEFNPLFLMRLVHLMRQNRVAEAIEAGSDEIQAALDAYATGEDDQGDGTGIVMVPTPERMLALYPERPRDELNSPKGPRQ
jgi:hypothetical protein